jgi:ATP-binding cassette subfamily G (WHITE) protein 1
VFLREVNNNMYNVGPYFWAKVISELPFSILTPCVFGTIVYFTVGLNPNVGTFFWMLFTLILIYNASSGYSLIISASFSDKQLAVTLTPVLIIPFMLFAGFFVSASSIPIFLKEFEYLSIFKYGFQALMLLEFTNNKNYPCALDGTDFSTCACYPNPKNRTETICADLNPLS